MTAKKGSGYAKVESPLIQRLLNHPVVAVASHWTFQSLFYMDRTERWFKLALDGLLTVLGGVIISTRCPGRIAWTSAFLLAHTMNFLFNGQLWGVLKHYGLVTHSYDEFNEYVHTFRQRAQNEPAIKQAAIYGSLARNEWSPSSDLDARLIRHPGLGNGLQACWFLLRERSRAMLSRFPLDVYVLDSGVSLQKMNIEELPIQVLDRNRF